MARERGRRYKARKLGADGFHTANQIRFLKNISGGFCPGYKKDPHHVGTDRLTVDHIVSLTKGGSDDIGNIQMMCKPCNSSKGTSLDLKPVTDD